MRIAAFSLWSIVLGTVLFVSPTGRAGSIGFEPEEGFPDGVLTNRHPGWNLTGAETIPILKGEGYQSAHSIAIGPEPSSSSVVHYEPRGIPADGVVFFAVALKPVVAEDQESTLWLGGIEIRFIRHPDGTIGIAPSHRQSTDVLETKTRATRANGEADGWIHLMVRQDLNRKTWDLWLDGTLVSMDEKLPASMEAPSLSLQGSPKGTTYMDAVAIGQNNPLFADQDSDGMPDAYEVAHGLNPYADDRNGDLDGDGVTNIREHLQGTPPDAVGTLAKRQILYVDNRIGSDANSGASSLAIGKNGPKASIKAAMAAAENNALIVVMPGSGVYEEGSRSAKGKRIVIRTVDNIVIQ